VRHGNASSSSESTGIIVAGADPQRQYDAAGNIVAVAHSNQPTFIGDPGNFITLKGSQPIVRVVVSGGMIDNASFRP
jgi:hypothetical protein